jgi:hypothetical protein
MKIVIDEHRGRLANCAVAFAAAHAPSLKLMPPPPLPSPIAESRRTSEDIRRPGQTERRVSGKK